MRTVTSENKIIHAQRPGHTYCRRLLSDGQVGGTGVVIGRTIVLSLNLYQINHRLEFTDQYHIVVDRFELLCGKIFFFLFYCFPVLVDRYRLKLHKPRFTGFARIY
ncbi:hypothetical protein SDC9_172935 [bioreactor metagenome]|uniref:Uncharacterized protein n=1 Tax=bioreactor metagenome TaxID=1076179 RepID=A0A645GP98_9ZZZZ